MKRYDLRVLKNSFVSRLAEIASSEEINHVAIYMLEISSQQSLSSAIKTLEDNSCEILNSIKYNEVDWTIVAKKGVND